MKKHLSFLLLLFYSVAVNAQVFDFNTNCKDAYHAVMSLQFNKATELLLNEKKQHPENAIPYFNDNYIDFLTIYINEDVNDFKYLEKNKEIRISKMKQADESSPYYLYTQAEILIQWAFARLKFEEYVNAFSEVKKAYNLLEENNKKFPSFAPNKKSLGMLHCIVGAIPSQYKWGINMLGMDGTVEQGLQEIKQVMDEGNSDEFLFREEASLYYAFLSLYLKNDDNTAWMIVQNLDTKTNLLNCFSVASIAMRTGRNDIAIQVLSQRPQGTKYFKYPYLDYILGLAKLRRLDSDASIYFNKFLKEFNGKNYIKETYQKLAWDQLLKNNKESYYSYMSFCKTRSDAIIDDDKQALAEANEGRKPDIVLLRSRLLF